MDSASHTPMHEEALIRGRRSRPRSRREPLARIADAPVLAEALGYPGYADPEDGARTRAFKL